MSLDHPYLPSQTWQKREEATTLVGLVMQEHLAHSGLDPRRL